MTHSANLSYGWKAHLVVYAAVPFSIFLRAYAVAALWLWFVTPIGLPALSQAHAYGLSMLAPLLVYTVPPVKDGDIVEIGAAEQRKATRREAIAWASAKLASAILLPLVCLLMGYAAHLAM